MVCLSVWGIMFVNIVSDVCMLVGGDVSKKAAVMSLVNCIQSLSSIVYSEHLYLQ